jgi:hypothetical protein
MIAKTNTSEPSAEIVEAFETVEDRTRREWSSAGCDYAYFVVLFLQGKRRLEVQPSEIVKTQLYFRSDDFEKHALEMVCATDREMQPSLDDERQLRTRDNFLCDYADRKTLGHADLVAQITSIPYKVAERQQFDIAMFPRTYSSPTLFSWLWER